MTARRKSGRRTLASRNNRSDAKHIRIYWWAFNSPAYRSLSCYARCALDELLFTHNGDNNGSIPGSVRWLSERLNISVNTVRRALDELVGKGFIKATVKGSFNCKLGARKGEATTWHLTMLDGPNGDLATKDFMRWQGFVTKQTTVSPGDTPCITTRYRQGESDSKKPKSVSPHDTVNPVVSLPTVSPRDTSIVYHPAAFCSTEPDSLERESEQGVHRGRKLGTPTVHIAQLEAPPA